MINERISASQLLQELVSNKKDLEKISFQEICDFLSERGFAILMILFSFPMIFPIPTPPGFTTALGIPLIYFSLQMLSGATKPSLPNWLANKTIQTSHLILIIDKFTKVLSFLEKLLKPRLKYFCSVDGEKLIGLIALLCALSVSLPIVFGNAIPSLGILIMSLGLLSRDGLVILLGIVISIIGLCITSFVLYLIFFGTKLILDGSFLNTISSFLKGK